MKATSDKGRIVWDCPVESVAKLREMIGYLRKALHRETEPVKVQTYRSAMDKCFRIIKRIVNEHFDERAAVLQFEGGYSRNRAEDLACDDTLSHFGIRDLVREKELAEAKRRFEELIELLNPKPSPIALELDRICSATPLLPAQ